jgi:hypothetical protein
MLEIHSMKTTPGCATVRVAADEPCLWSWFTSVQAATHHEHGDKTGTDHLGWDVSFWVAVSIRLLGVLVALLARLGNVSPLRKTTADYAD